MPIEEVRRERWVANVKQLLLRFGPAVLDLDRGLADALPGGAGGGGAASGRGRQPVIHRTYSRPSDEDKAWIGVEVAVAKAACIAFDETRGVTGDQELVDLGLTLAEMLRRNPTSWNKGAMMHGNKWIQACVLNSMQGVGQDAYAKLLLSIRIATHMSWNHLGDVADRMGDVMDLYGIRFRSKTDLMNKTKELFRDRYIKPGLLIRTVGPKAPKGKRDTPGAFFNARDRFEMLMSTEAIRLVLKFPKGRLVLGMEFDARTLARKPWWNCLIGLVLLTSADSNRPQNFHCMGLYDGKEDPKSMAMHAKVGCPPRNQQPPHASATLLPFCIAPLALWPLALCTTLAVYCLAQRAACRISWHSWRSCASVDTATSCGKATRV